MCDLVAVIPPPKLYFAPYMRGRTRRLYSGVALEISGALRSGWGKKNKTVSPTMRRRKRRVRPEPAEAAIDNTPNASDRLVKGEPQLADQSVADITVPQHSAKMGIHATTKGSWMRWSWSIRWRRFQRHSNSRGANIPVLSHTVWADRIPPREMCGCGTLQAA